MKTSRETIEELSEQGYTDFMIDTCGLWSRQDESSKKTNGQRFVMSVTDYDIDGAYKVAYISAYIKRDADL